jgi:hypothetical protein
MKKYLLLIFSSVYINSVIAAEFTEQQMREISKKVVEDTVATSKLTDEYKAILRPSLEKLMYDDRVIKLTISMINEESIHDTAGAEKLGFTMMGLIREKAVTTLSSQEMIDLINLNLKLISKMTAFECAQYIKKKRVDENRLGRGIYEIAGELTFIEFKRFVNLYDAAFENFFLDQKKSTQLPKNELDKVKSEFQGLMMKRVMQDEFLRNFFQSGKSFSESADSDVCRVGTEILKTVVSGEKKEIEKRVAAYVHGQLN